MCRLAASAQDTKAAALLEAVKYQLVLQFQATNIRVFDELVMLEEFLVENLPSTSDVDGHDFGADEFNIFILTNHPEESFQNSKKLIDQGYPQHQLKAAYRGLGKNEFVILWAYRSTGVQSCIAVDGYYRLEKKIVARC
jgi:hypothetical protein